MSLREVQLIRVPRVAARGSTYGIDGFWVWLVEVAGVSALSGRGEIGSCIYVHKLRNHDKEDQH
jgi:hypothetical protein